LPSTRARTYRLTPELIAAHAGSAVLCLAHQSVGRTYRLHRDRPETNRRLYRTKAGGIVSADLPSGANHAIAPVEEAPALIRVDISGALEQRAGYHDVCAGWSDGHDAICERLCEAFKTADVLVVGDTPGGAAAGIQQNVARALAAKERYGRRVTGWADEQIGSAGVWWMLAVCDELFIPVQGTVGSIGARAGHMSIAEALAKEGVVQTYFADPPDKIAFAPEFPLSPEGKRRGERDVKIVADAFRAAVCTSPIGVRRGLTPELLIALGADMLTGQAAVDAGLADGVATFEEVSAYALALAEREEASVKEKAHA
jgi:ClpP class serine protease